MPALKLLPLGTVFVPKKKIDGFDDLRFMVTGWFPRSKVGDDCYDYTVTPWPLGLMNMDDGGKERFFSCNEDSVGEIEAIGGVDDSLERAIEMQMSNHSSMHDFDSPLAVGAKSLMVSKGDIPCTLGDFPLAEDERLPMGSIVSTVWEDRKAMIYGYGGRISNERYDYTVFPWPDGANPGSETLSLVNNEDITAVHFRGYENALSQELIKCLEKKRRGSLFSRIFGKVKEW